MNAALRAARRHMKNGDGWPGTVCDTIKSLNRLTRSELRALQSGLSITNGSSTLAEEIEAAKTKDDLLPVLESWRGLSVEEIQRECQAILARGADRWNK